VAPEFGDLLKGAQTIAVIADKTNRDESTLCKWRNRYRQTKDGSAEASPLYEFQRFGTGTAR